MASSADLSGLAAAHQAVVPWSPQRALSWMALVATFAGLMAVLFLSDYLRDEALLVTAIFALGVISWLGAMLVADADGYLIVYLLICIFLWIAYVVKFVFIVFDPLGSWLSQDFFAASEIRGDLGDAFLSVTPGLLALLIGMAAIGRTRWRSGNGDALPRMRNNVFVSVIVALLFLRLFNQMVLGIGLPGAKSAAFAIPFVGGVLELLSRSVLFALVNMYFYAVLRLKAQRGLLVAITLLLLNVALGLRVGYKSELVLHGVFVLYCIFQLRNQVSPARRRMMSMTAVVIISATVILYPLINNYRFQRLGGQAVSEAIASTLSSGTSAEPTFMLAIVNRINGIDAYYAATKLGAGIDLKWTAIFDNSVMDLIKQHLYGGDKDEAVTAFGTTQLSVLYLSGGMVGLICGGLLLGACIGTSFFALRRWVFRYAVTYEALLLSLCVLWVKLLSSGGLILLYVKEWFLVVFCVALIERAGFFGGTDTAQPSVPISGSRSPANLMR
jgi:hypothetical protein